MNKEHKFVRKATYLGVEEVQDGEEASVDDGKEQVGSPANAVNHDGRDHDDEEVEEPVGARRDGVGLCASLDGADLGRVEPRERQPGRSKGGDVGEEADGGALCGAGGARDQAGKGQHHGEHLAGRAPEEELAASDTLDDEPRDGGKGGVDNHVDAAQQHGHVVSLADGVLEEDGEVVDDGVAAADLLHELGRGAEQHAAEVLRLAVGEEGLDGGALLAGEARGADGVEDHVPLGLCLLAVDFISTEGGNGPLGLLVPLVGEEPARAVGQPDHDGAEDEGEDDLEGNGEAPDEVIGPVGRTVVDPVRNQRAKGDDAALDADEEAAVGRLAALGLVRRDGGRVDAVADAGDDAPDDELRQLPVALHGGDLDDGAKDHDDAADDDGAPAAEQVSHGEDEDGTDQAADLVDGRHQALHGGISCLGEVVVEDGRGDDAAHDALVIAEEKECSRRNGRDAH